MFELLFLLFMIGVPSIYKTYLVNFILPLASLSLANSKRATKHHLHTKMSTFLLILIDYLDVLKKGVTENTKTSNWVSNSSTKFFLIFFFLKKQKRANWIIKGTEGSFEEKGIEGKKVITCRRCYSRALTVRTSWCSLFCSELSRRTVLHLLRVNWNVD